ncbi:HAD-IC family P-type ATPase [Corynebacterium hansenii]|uniref:HAD-IC family P-type ATPase n=1 Tax=Corynebacterium hansenii TaxID=394964 RepID=A0ABV7ZNA5_9CORY|nr:HAD-IC family P-type ATPase [Corynebacterium hansenii]WJY99213.1 putative cation-transporting ATPase F [Corynebacterium hansenii]
MADHEPHALSTSDALSLVNSGDGGLASAEASRRLASDGPNALPEPDRDGVVTRFLGHFNDPLIHVLLAAAAITALMRHWIDTAVILLVVVVNALIGFIQEGQAEKALEGLRTMLTASARVLRDGSPVTVPADELVAGDVVLLGPGDRVPADLRLLRTSDLRVDESPLTGESEPVTKGAEPVPADAGVGDRTSMAFSGTLAVAGTGAGVVTAIGRDTEIGRIDRMLGDVQTLETPLTRSMAKFGKQLTFIVVGLAVLLMAVSRLVHGSALLDVGLQAISFAVAAIPEGLPAVMAIALARGVQVMARRNAITRKLGAVETLGSVSVICTDKTGTLTKNEMTVREAVVAAGPVEISGTGYSPDGELSGPAAGDPAIRALAAIADRANEAEGRRKDGRWLLVGEPTDGALRVFALKAGHSRGADDRVSDVPFNSDNKWMAVHDDAPAPHDLPPAPAGGDDGSVFLKGAPDRLLDLCTHEIAPGGGVRGLDRGFWEAEIDRLSGRGLRVLAGAFRRGGASESDGDLDENDVALGGFTFAGLYGIIDPPRPEAIEAVAHCRAAGIRVKMITGDHAGTASAIAREMGIGDPDPATGEIPAITGRELEAMDDGELARAAAAHDVFARTSPEHKLRLVGGLQSLGEVVSMTGDGVNDAPALKRADVGVAMGVKGTEATKEAADVVLADDNFSSIARAVREGRAIHDNLRKTIVYMLPTNGSEALVMFAAVMANLTLPLTPLQILWVNMVCAVTLGVALAFEDPEPDVMDRPPRDPGEPLLDGMAGIRIAVVSLLLGGMTMAVFYWALDGGTAVGTARTLAVNALVVGQIWYLFNARHLREHSFRADLFTTNPASWIAVAALVALQLLFTYAPFMHAAFGSAPLGAAQWGLIVALGTAVFAVVEGEKALGRVIRRSGRRPGRRAPSPRRPATRP